MTNYLVLRMQNHMSLEQRDIMLLDRSLSSRRSIKQGEKLIREGDKPVNIAVVQSGLLYRFKMLSNGRRQILSYIMPGDFCDLYGFLFDTIDHSTSALIDATICEITPEQVEELCESPRLRKAFWCLTLVQESIAREWIANIGGRSAMHRIAHFFCEMMYRMDVADLCKNGICKLPLTQTDIADTLGLSLVHTNKSIQNLRRIGILSENRVGLEMRDLDGLARFCSFEPEYLRLPAPKSVPGVNIADTHRSLAAPESSRTS